MGRLTLLEANQAGGEQLADDGEAFVGRQTVRMDGHYRLRCVRLSKMNSENFGREKLRGEESRREKTSQSALRSRTPRSEQGYCIPTRQLRIHENIMGT